MNKQKIVNEVTGERLTLGGSSARCQADHTARYKFAEQFVLNKKVLDIACGTGYGCVQLSEAGAAIVIGIDIDDSAIKYAQEHHNRDNITYVVGSADKIEYPDNFFDIIVSFETIEHLEDYNRKKYLSELNRIVKPSGTVLISTPNKRITSPWSKKPLNQYHILEFDSCMLERELSESGLKIHKWYGQRFVNSFFTYRLTYLMVRVLEKIFRRHFGIYDIADGPTIKPWQNGVPRYFLVECSK